MKFLLLGFLLAGSLTSYAQRTMDLTEDMTITETLVISENTTINGNGFRIICDDCDPVISVVDDSDLQLVDVVFTRTFKSWIRVQGPECSASWRSPSTSGGINFSPRRPE